MNGMLKIKLNLKMSANGRELGIVKNGENIHDAVQEKVKLQEIVKILDASTLGKIDIQGTDASEFLNRVYTNVSKLAIGKCRYGLMLNEDGMVYDDGVTTRLRKPLYYDY